LEEIGKDKEITMLIYKGRYFNATHFMEIAMGHKIFFIQGANG
jgi:hypothetical protein